MSDPIFCNFPPLRRTACPNFTCFGAKNFLSSIIQIFQTAQSTMSRHSLCKIWDGFKRGPRDGKLATFNPSSQREYHAIWGILRERVALSLNLMCTGKNVAFAAPNRLRQFFQTIKERWSALPVYLRSISPSHTFIAPSSLSV